jgi:hypothetical protein
MANEVPQGGCGVVQGSGVTGIAPPGWEVTQGVSTIATNLVPNGWGVSLGSTEAHTPTIGEPFNLWLYLIVCAPLSASLGAYNVRWLNSTELSYTPALFTVVEAPPDPEELDAPVIDNPGDEDSDSSEEPTNGRCYITLAWNEVLGATIYDLERRRPSDNFASIYSGQVNSYTDMTAEIGQEYYYRARARNAEVTGAWSEVLVLSNVCNAEWTISPLPEASDFTRTCAPAASNWTKGRC